MASNQAFYHSHTRNIVIMFGKLFDDITVNRFDTNNDLVTSIKVPITYAIKQKFIERIQAAPSLDTGRAQFQLTLPRMSFEITGLQYDSTRKLTSSTKQQAIQSDNSIKSAYVSVPYNIQMELSIYSKNQDDALQIVEQILPVFFPDFNLKINELPELGVIRDIQIVLDSIVPDITYEGPANERNIVMWNLSFTIKANYFGYVQDPKLIKKSILSLFATPTAGPLNKSVGVQIITTPDPSNASPTDSFDYIQEFDNIQTS